MPTASCSKRPWRRRLPPGSSARRSSRPSSTPPPCTEPMARTTYSSGESLRKDLGCDVTTGRTGALDDIGSQLLQGLVERFENLRIDLAVETGPDQVGEPVVVRHVVEPLDRQQLVSAG